MRFKAISFINIRARGYFTEPPYSLLKILALPPAKLNSGCKENIKFYSSSPFEQAVTGFVLGEGGSLITNQPYLLWVAHKEKPVALSPRWDLNPQPSVI